MFRSVGYLAAALLPLVLIILNSNEGWHRSHELWETSRYLVNVGLFFVWAVELFVFAFLASRAGRKALVGLCLFLASCLGCLGVSDLYILFLNHDTTGPGGSMCLTHRNWYQRVVSNNSLGFWEKDVQPLVGRVPGSKPLVVAAVGDSFTWGQGVLRASDRYTDRLSAELGDEVEVINFGVGGLNTREEIQMVLPHAGSLNPDLVVLFYLTNDIHDGLGISLPSAKARGKWAQRALVGSPSWNYLYWRLFASLEYHEAAIDANKALYARYQDPQNFADHQRDLKLFVRSVKKMGARPAAVILPFPHLWNDAPPGLREELLGKIEEALKEAEMPVLNLAELEETYPVGRFEVNPMDAHPNAEVHRAIAEKTLPWLKELLFK